MNYDFLNNEEYKDIPLLYIEENKNGLPFYIGKRVIDNKGTSVHRHQYIQINYVCRGIGRHMMNGNPFDIVKGDIFVIPPYIPHRIFSQGTDCLEIVEFEFSPDFINCGPDNSDSVQTIADFAYIEPFLVSENQVKPRLNLIGKKQLEVEEILNEALKEYSERASGYTLMIKSLLLKLLTITGREFSKDFAESDSYPVFAKHKEAISEAMKYIDTNFSEDLNSDDVAKKFLLSPSYFRYLFKNITSCSFTEYLNKVRLLKAMELLRSTEERVIDICNKTGFGSVNYFNRFFKQQTGITPLEYRRGTFLCN